MSDVMSTNADTMLRTPEIVQEVLLDAYRSSGMTWAEMASLSDYTPIPAGTLCAIANGAEIPRKWYRKLRVYTPRARALRPPTFEINAKDMDSASRSIIKHIPPDLVQKLIDLLVIDSRYPG